MAALQSDDILEALLRQLAAAREYRLTGDTEMCNHILGVRPPGSSVTPTWLADESRAHATAMFKQNQRVPTRRQTGAEQSASSAGAGTTEGARRRPGRGKGAGKGAKGHNS